MGFAVSRGVLRPVTRVAEASARVAAGRLDTRLATGQDRDLSTLAASFNSMAESLQRRIQRDAAFAGDVSHELRSPLTTLVTSASVLYADRDELPQRDAAAVELITTELSRFERLVEDLIEIARADAGVELDLQAVDLRVLVIEAVRRSAYATLPLEITDGQYAFTVLGDKRRLDRVIQNLLENAERHAGGATRATLYATAGSVRLDIDDRGPGVPPADRERIFERFARGAGVDGRREATGSGIGLALVAEHVRMHGGRVWVEENEHGGATFSVELPRSRS
jgi:signal transduction histidine kinase